MEDSETTFPVKIKCPKCGRRILDLITVTKGMIELKCPHCGKIVKVDLTLQKNGVLKYRVVKD
jgi:uncharacterized Zn finger protein